MIAELKDDAEKKVKRYLTEISETPLKLTSHMAFKKYIGINLTDFHSYVTIFPKHKTFLSVEKEAICLYYYVDGYVNKATKLYVSKETLTEYKSSFFNSADYAFLKHKFILDINDIDWLLKHEDNVKYFDTKITKNTGATYSNNTDTVVYVGTNDDKIYAEALLKFGERNEN